jgi:hypothetical protein
VVGNVWTYEIADEEAGRFLHEYDDALAFKFRFMEVQDPTWPCRDLGFRRTRPKGQYRNIDLQQDYEPQPRPTTGAEALINFVCADGMSWQQIPHRRQLDAYCDWDEKGNRINKVTHLFDPQGSRGIDVAPSNPCGGGGRWIAARELAHQSSQAHYLSNCSRAPARHGRETSQRSRLHVGTISREVRAQARGLSEGREVPLPLNDMRSPCRSTF